MPLTRRQLFGGAVRAGQKIAQTASGDGAATQHKAPRPCAELDAIAGDFPPEMLQMEAQRLGLNPETLDRTQLLEAMLDAMAHGRGPRETGETE